MLDRLTLTPERIAGMAQGVRDVAALPDPEGKVHLLMSYTGTGRDVADPWYTGDFETAFQDILTGCEAMLRGAL